MYIIARSTRLTGMTLPIIPSPFPLDVRIIGELDPPVKYEMTGPLDGKGVPLFLLAFGVAPDLHDIMLRLGAPSKAVAQAEVGVGVLFELIEEGVIVPAEENVAARFRCPAIGYLVVGLRF